MFKSKYSNTLTVVLIIAIVVIVIVATILVINVYKKHKNSRDAAIAISDFDSNLEDEVNDIDTQKLIEQDIVESVPTSNQKGTRKVTYYKNFVMLGYIEIPKIKLRQPILEKETAASLEQSVAIRYPKYAILNSIGNVVIAGHNYRNGMFFSNLKKVTIGDIVRITDTNGKTLTYTIYETYYTFPEDTAYMTRDVGENIEVTLVTCSNDSSQRLIVKAKV